MPERRRPQQSPGPAHNELAEDDDFTLPAALFSDAVYFLHQARGEADAKDPGHEERFLRAALSAAIAAFEALVNQAAFGHAQAHGGVLGQIERDVLEERETVLDDHGRIVRRTRFYPLEARISFLALFLSGQEFDRSTELWRRLVQAKNLRDAWAHPKPPFNTWGLEFETIRQAVVTVIDVVLEISRLMAAEVPPWLGDQARALDALAARQDDDR